MANLTQWYNETIKTPEGRALVEELNKGMEKTIRMEENGQLVLPPPMPKEFIIEFDD
jgi:hypothetical protein